MKSLFAITVLGFLSFFSEGTINDKIVLEELELNITNFEYEAELASANYVSNNNFYLQNIDCNDCSNFCDVTLESVQLDIPNYKYLEELESVNI